MIGRSRITSFLLGVACGMFALWIHMLPLNVQLVTPEVSAATASSTVDRMQVEGCPAYHGTLSSLARKYTPSKFFPYLHSGYHRIYDTFLDKYRGRRLRFLEIGIDSGRGTLLWQEYFPCAKLFGIEYEKNTAGVTLGRSVAEIFQGDQANATFLQDIIDRTGGNFDVIIDDGGHSFSQQMTSYRMLFEHALKPGGTYIIEDIETSYWEGSFLYGQHIVGGVNASSTTVSSFKNIVDVINRKFHDNLYNVAGKVDWWIKGVSFFQNVIILEKKDEADRPYDSHYVWPKKLRAPAKMQGNEFSYGPSPYSRDISDLYWLALRHAPLNWQKKSKEPVRTWASDGTLVA